MKQRARRWILFGAWAALLAAACVLSVLTRPGESPGATRPAPVLDALPAGGPSGAPPAGDSGEVSGESSAPRSEGREQDDPPARETRNSGGFSIRALDADSRSPLSAERLVLSIRGGARMETREVETDSLGSAWVEGLEPGLRSVEVRAAGRLPASRAVEIAIGATEEIDVLLRGGAEISGRVLGPSGSPVAGAHVRASLAVAAAGAGAPGPELAAAQASDSGEFRLVALRPGPWRLTAHAPGHRRRTVDVKAPSAGITVLLREDPGFDVRVSDGAGSPVEGARVINVSRTRGISAGVRSAITPASGRVRLDGLPGDPEEEVPVEVRHPGYRTARVSVPAEALESSGLDVTLLRGGTLSGRALGPEGEGIAGAEVRLSREGSSERPALLAATSTGEFAFEKLEAGSYRIEVIGGGRRGEASAIVEEGSAAPRMEITLQGVVAAGDSAAPTEPPPRPGTISGVIDLPEEPGEALTVRVASERSRDGGFDRQYRFSSGDQSFRVRNVPPGTYRVELLAGDRPVASAQGIEVVSGQETEPVRLR